MEIFQTPISLGISPLSHFKSASSKSSAKGDAASDAYRSGRKINNYVDDVGKVLTEGKKNSSKGRKLVDKLKDKAKKVKNKVTSKKKNGVGVVGVPKSGKVVDEVVESGSTSILDNANYAQKTYSNTFSPEGIKKYSDLAGETINTIDDLVSAINNGNISVSDLPIEYIVRDGNTLILNTRTSQALTQAGVPRSQWISVDRTGNQLFEQLLDEQLLRNKLTSEGISTVRLGGKK